MSVSEGTRPGTQPKDNYPGWKYVKSKGPGWMAIHAQDREVMRWEGEMNAASDNLKRAMMSAKIGMVMLHGGHVDAGALALSGLRLNMEPAQVVAHIQDLMNKEIHALK